MEDKTNIRNQQDLKEKNKPEKNTEKKGKISVKVMVLTVLAVAVLLAGCTGFYFFNAGKNNFSTNNAKVTAKMYPITANMTGELLEWRVKAGQRIQKDEIMGRQEALPYITSPITGTIVKNDGIEGQTVNPASQLAVVADTDNLYIEVNIEETNIEKIRAGQKVDVKIDAYPGKIFNGVVSEIDRTTQTYFSGTSSFSTSGTYTKVTQLIPVKVLIENKEKLPLTFGMNAFVTIHLKEDASKELLALTAKAKETAETKKETTYSSAIEASDQVMVVSKISGRISLVKAEVGQSVKAGDVLFALDDTDLKLQLKQAEASYNAAVFAYNSSKEAYDSKSSITPAKVASDAANTSYEQTQQLYASGFAAKSELDSSKAKADTALAELQQAENSAKTALDTTKAQMESAESSLEIIQKQLEECTVTAPISGEVSLKGITMGDMTSPQAAAITLINVQNLKVHINVTETKIGKVKVGAKVTVKVQAAGVTTQGTVVNISPASDSKTGLFPVEILINNEDGKLKPGMMSNVELQTE